LQKSTDDCTRTTCPVAFSTASKNVAGLKERR
jgi:hypothetical protein